ncbi:MAG: TonB-dependent receptor [Rhizomicrobium sp.]
MSFEKRFVRAAAGFGLLLIPSLALAQNDTGSVETVTVTGTRIPRPETDMPNPVTAVSAAEIEHSGTVNLTDYLKRIPALTGSLNDFQTSGYNTPASDDGSSLGGLNLLDLRNLGYVRTLVLIDGHRTVGQATGSTAVDIDSIPITMIDRIEVVTGGSSAVYGADGVSGVVNFVMKHNLEGITAKVQAGTSQDGGGSKYLAAVSVGHDIDNGNGNVALTFEDSYQDRLNYMQRSFTQVGGFTAFVPNPVNKHGKKLNLPANIPTNDAQFIFSAPSGAIDTTVKGREFPTYLGDGQPFIAGVGVGGGSAIGSSGMPYANDLQGDFLPIEHRRIGQVQIDDRFSNWFKVSTELKYAHVDTKSANIAPYDDDIMITAQNAFLPANVAAAIAANKFGQGALSEDYLDMREAERVARDTYRGVLDISGDFPLPSFFHDAKYDLSYEYGKTDIDDEDENNRNIDRFVAALDSVIDPATGQPTCRSNLHPNAIPPTLRHYYGKGNNYFSDEQEWFPNQFGTTFTPGPNSGCVPYNPFDPNYNNKAAIAWMTQNTHVWGYLSQQDLNGYVSFNLPQVQDWGLAKPISFVFGGEYRFESSRSTPEAITEVPQLYWVGGTLPVAGSFNVSEAYGETSIPLVADKPLVKELTIDFAGRLSSYSTAGDNQSWKMDAVYSPFSFIKFRGTDAVAVRAPNIGELFAPNQQLYAFVDDPCDADYIGQGTKFRAANCQAIENALGVPYKAGKTNVQTDSTTPNLVGGNDGLKPETARTQTLGVVLQPDFLQDFVATADWYRVDITDAIEAPDAQQVANECVDLSTIVNPYCAEVQRTATGNFPGSIKEVTTRQINVASFFTQGIDFSISYHADLERWFDRHMGSVDLHLIGNHLDSISTTPLQGEAPIQSANTYDGGVDGQPAPYWQMNLDVVWNFEAWSVDYNVDWYDGILNFERQQVYSEPNIVAPQFLHQPPHDVHSIQVSYDIREGWNIYAGINNLWYQKPSIGNNGLPTDPLGRFFYGGLKVDVDPF